MFKKLQPELLFKLRVLFSPSEVKKTYLIFIGIVLMGFIELIGISSIAPFIAVVLEPDMIHENIYLSYAYRFLSANNSEEFIAILGISVVIALLVSNILQVFINWQIIHFTNVQTYRLSVRLLDKYLNEPYSFYLNKNPSEMSKNILSEVARGVHGVVLQVMTVISKAIVVIFIFILLLWLDPLTAIVSVLTLGVAYGLIHHIVKDKVKSWGVGLTEESFKAYKAVNESMSAIKYIKFKSCEKKFVDLFRVPAENISLYSTKSSLVTLLPRYILEVIIFGGMILIVVFSERKGIKIVPIISLYAMAGYRLMPALQTIYSGVTSVRYAMPAFNLIVNDLSKRTNTNKINNNSLSFSKDLEVKNLCYGYHASKNLIVNKLDLSIKKNTTIAIVGTTGSGKTTLMDLLLGLITPNSGDIYLDNIKLNDKNIHIWRNIIGYVPQSIYLTDDTIEKNIAFGVDCNEIDKSQVAKVAKIANLDNFINTLPERYDTFVGERGVRLSGGQQQRIGIARALYHDPDIIMLDEATSSLDSITENSIMEAIHNIAHQKTIIMIAHRLSTIKECDEIHMMDHGRIVDSGTYEHLISFNKEFKKMTNGAF